MRLPWDPEEFIGVGPSTQPICAIPCCERTTEARGLCNACLQAWVRNGMAGLERRAVRLRDGIPCRVHVPLDVDRAMEMLLSAYEELMERADGDDVAYARQRQRVIKICKAIGTVEQRREYKLFQNNWKAHYIEKHGIEAWRQKRTEAQRAHRARMVEKGFTRVQRNGKVTWEKISPLTSQAA